MKQPSKKARGGDQLFDLSTVSLLKYYFVIHDDQGKKYKRPKRLCFLKLLFPVEFFLPKIILQN